jgi:hypothetical protein
MATAGAVIASTVVVVGAIAVEAVTQQTAEAAMGQTAEAAVTRRTVDTAADRLCALVAEPE